MSMDLVMYAFMGRKLFSHVHSTVSIVSFSWTYHLNVPKCKHDGIRYGRADLSRDITYLESKIMYSVRQWRVMKDDQGLGNRSSIGSLHISSAYLDLCVKPNPANYWIGWSCRNR